MRFSTDSSRALFVGVVFPLLLEFVSVAPDDA